MKRSAFVLLAFVGVLVLLVATAYALLASERGSAWLVKLGTAFSPVPIEYSGVEGSLIDGLRLERLSLTAPAVAIDAEAVLLVVDWLRSIASRRSIVFDTVTVGRLNVDRIPSEPTGKKPIEFELPVLPFEIELVTVQIGQFTTGLVDAAYHPALSFSAHFGAEQWRIANLELRAPAVRADGGLQIEIGESMPAAGSFAIRLPDRDIRGDVKVSGDLSALRLDADLRIPQPLQLNARLAILGREVVELNAHVVAASLAVDPIEAQGFEGDVRAELGSPLVFDVEGRAADVAWGTRHAREVSLDVAGTVEQYTLDAQATVLVPNLPDASVAMNVRGGRTRFDAIDYVITTGSGSLQGSGQASLEPLTIDLVTRIEHFDPGYFLDFLSGDLSGESTVAIRRDEFVVDVGSLTGTLNEQPVEMHGRVARMGEAWTVDDFVATAGPNSVSAAGRWAEEGVEVEGALNVPAVANLYPDVVGDVRGRFSARGKASAPDIQLSIDSKSIAFDGATLESVSVRASVAQGRIRQANALAAKAQLAGMKVENVSLVGEGRIEQFAATTGLRFGTDETKLEWTGAWRDGRLDVDLAPGGRIAAAGETLSNESGVAVRWAEGALSMSGHCWRRLKGEGRLCIDRVELARQSRLSGSLAELPVAVLSAFAPQLPAARGAIGGRWNFEREAADGQWRGEAELVSERLALLEPGSADDEPVEVPDITAFVKLTTAGIELRAAMGDTTDGVFVVDLVLDGYAEDAAVRGHVAVNAENMATLSQFSRRVGDVAGVLRGRFELAGTRAVPRVSGKIEFIDGRFVWLDPHLEVSDLAIDITMPEPERIELKGSGVTERGRVDITGVVLEPFVSSRRATFDIDAATVEVGLPEGQVRVDAKLELMWQDGAFDLRGKVDVPFARIVVAELPESSVRRSRDVVVVDRTVEAEEVTRLAVDLDLTLGDDVRFAAFGLDTRLIGRMRLRQARDGGVRLNGTLTLKDGEFGAFGQTLTIESGRLLFSGPPGDPRVTARAVRVIEEPTRAVKVGVDIQGRTGAVESTLFSSPVMPEADILSYLVLGRPLSAASAQESGDITGAAVALGLKGAAPIIDEIRGAFGLEELTATGGSSEELAVIAGKRISERVYVRYSYQTFSRMSALLVRLALNNRLSLEATAAETPAMDLIYRVGPES